MNPSSPIPCIGKYAATMMYGLGILLTFPGNAEQQAASPVAIKAPEQLPAQSPDTHKDSKQEPDIPIDEKALPSDASDAPADKPAEVTKDGKVIVPARQADADTGKSAQNSNAKANGAPSPVPNPAAPQQDWEKEKEIIPNNLPVQPDAAREQEKADLQPEQTYMSSSSSKQFIVRGKNINLVSAICTRGDEIRSGLLSLLKLPNTWKENVFINLFGAPGSRVPEDPVRLGINIVENKPNYYINLHVGNGIDLDALYNAVTTMLLYEVMLRNVNPDGLPEQISLPQWILTGIEQAVQWKNDRADRNLYATLFERDEILSPKDLLSIKSPRKELDAMSLSAYKASCGALILCLLNQKEGEDAMIRLLNEAILGSDDPENLIKRNFPRLSLTPTSLHKWWSLQLSTMATPSVTEALSIQNSEKKLDDLLILLKYDPETRASKRIPLSNLEEALKLPDLRNQLSNILNNLSYLSNRNFPTYRPIIMDYMKIIALIQNSGITKKTLDKKSIQERLDKLAKFRALSLQAANRSRDYMDWYEINSRNTLSNTFSSYMSTMKMLRDPARTSPTPIGKYLDDIEALYLQPAQSPMPQLSVKP